MALTVTEASAVNDLLRWLGLHADSRFLHDSPEDIEGRARAAASLLADHAHQRLMAGVQGADVEERWSSIEADDLRAVAVCEALAFHESHNGSIPWPSVRRPYEAWKASR